NFFAGRALPYVIEGGKLTWKLMGNHYWYCAIPEHISFLSERWFRHAATSLDLRLVELTRYRHLKEPLPQQAREALSNLTFLMLPRVVGALRRRHLGNAGAALHPAILDEVPPPWMSAKDHILVQLRHS
ncbi:MAG TPA: hypothetical protein VLN59_01580, partial [Burkholderiales bacterium]|nr:hypothetical protein [Burkholderiales bacterium]